MGRFKDEVLTNPCHYDGDYLYYEQLFCKHKHNVHTLKDDTIIKASGSTSVEFPRRLFDRYSTACSTYLVPE